MRLGLFFKVKYEMIIQQKVNRNSKNIVNCNIMNKTYIIILQSFDSSLKIFENFTHI